MSEPLTLDLPATDIERYVAARRRSPGLAFVLALFFGPVGALYANGLWGGALILLALGLGAITGGLGALPVWLYAIVAAHDQAIAHNERVLTEARLIAHRGGAQ